MMKKKMNLKFIDGVNSIGGNKILLEADDTRLFFDFGMNFSNYGKYFEEYLSPRVGNGFGDWLELGLIPHPKKIPACYRDDLLAVSGFKKKKEVEIDGVLLSHVHFDHSSYIGFLDEKIPIFASETTREMARALLECGQRSLGSEIYNYRLRPLDSKEAPVERDWKTAKSKKKFKVGNLEVKPYAVDHSVPGAMSYLIYTSEGTILYSGDLRLHGTYGYLTEEMLKDLEKDDIDLMLCEGTRINEVDNQSEDLVKRQSHDIISKCKELVIADYAFKDLTRFKTFYEIAKENNRKFAIGLKDAHLVRELGELVDLPKLTDDQLLIYLDKRGSGTYTEKDYPGWMKEFYELPNTITAEEIHKRQKDIIVRMSFYDFNDFVDIKPNPGSQYIHSMCEAFNEEMAISHERMKNWLVRFGLPWNQIHCSGHANALDLKTIIETAGPKTLTPIHTEHREKFKGLVGKGVEVEYAKVSKTRKKQMGRFD